MAEEITEEKADASDKTDRPPLPGNWFKLRERSLWHAVGHYEYGVVWSTCGLRALEAEVEKCEDLDVSMSVCVKCSSSASGSRK